MPPVKNEAGDIIVMTFHAEVSHKINESLFGEISVIFGFFTSCIFSVAPNDLPHTSDTAFSSSRSTVSDAERDNADVSIRPNSN